ncbi:transcriptional regulator, AraC family protein [Pedobacter sp. BAL39]|uniref:helix-turn-helix domain-containing protein n=1 Tax=Pedobacter sp. BAL39 TaxID=391596 RepID=UPI000155AA1D|nr:helix-turn-helix domain-containing protein [Pedobacter sp. BAL39]EDM34420.1 transcriptional regulator, AraC family protein [Pedobacter sp. BAL39]
MEETKGLLEKIRQHDKLSIALNKDCKIALPDDVMEILVKPHRLSFYYFQYIDVGSAIFKTDLEEFTIRDGQLAFGVPNQIITKLPYDKSMLHYALSFDEQTLTLLPGSYPFLGNPLNANSITFDPMAQERVKIILLTLFQLLHFSKIQRKAEVILAYLHTLMTEFNSAYFEEHKGREMLSNSRISKYIAFKLAVETNMTEQHDVNNIAESLAMTSNSLYRTVKEFSGVSPKEWITNRLMLEAQRKLQYSTISVKELAYSLGFNDPGYFSRLFKKNTGRSVSSYLAELQDLSRN